MQQAPLRDYHTSPPDSPPDEHRLGPRSHGISQKGRQLPKPGSQPSRPADHPIDRVRGEGTRTALRILRRLRVRVEEPS